MKNRYSVETYINNGSKNRSRHPDIDSATLAAKSSASAISHGSVTIWDSEKHQTVAEFKAQLVRGQDAPGNMRIAKP